MSKATGGEEDDPTREEVERLADELSCSDAPIKNQAARMLLDLRRQRDRLRRHLAEAEKEVADTNATFDLTHAAEMRAVKRWREANPGNDLKLPGVENLTVWLLDQFTTAERRLEEFRRDAEQQAESFIRQAEVHYRRRYTASQQEVARLTERLEYVRHELNAMAPELAGATQALAANHTNDARERIHDAALILDNARDTLSASPHQPWEEQP